MADPEADRLVAELGSKFDEIAAVIARRLGFGPLAGMPPGLRTRVNEEVRDALEAWSIAQLGASPPPLNNPLQRLLAEHRAIELRILDLRRGGPPAAD